MFRGADSVTSSDVREQPQAFAGNGALREMLCLEKGGEREACNGFDVNFFLGP